MPVSRPAVSQHLAVLKDAGLVTDPPVETRQLHNINPRGHCALRAGLDQFGIAPSHHFSRRAGTQGGQTQWSGLEACRSLVSIQEYQSPGMQRRLHRLRSSIDDQQIGAGWSLRLPLTLLPMTQGVDAEPEPAGKLLLS